MPPADPAAFSDAVATVREAIVRDEVATDLLSLVKFAVDCELIGREFVRLLDAGELVRVREMEWETPCGPYSIHSAATVFGVYSAGHYPKVRAWWITPQSARGYKHVECDSLNEAKAAADAHYRSRLAAALEPLLPEIEK